MKSGVVSAKAVVSKNTLCSGSDVKGPWTLCDLLVESMKYKDTHFKKAKKYVYLSLLDMCGGDCVCRGPVPANEVRLRVDET